MPVLMREDEDLPPIDTTFSVGAGVKFQYGLYHMRGGGTPIASVDLELDNHNPANPRSMHAATFTGGDAV